MSTGAPLAPHPVTVTTARVYGSQSRYGGQPRESPLAAPLRLRDFPVHGYTAEVHLGSPVDWLFRADTLSRAAGAAALEGLFGPAGAENRLQARVQELVRDGALARASGTHQWYVTLALSHVVTVAPGFVNDHPYIWLDPAEALRIERAEQAVAAAALDVVAASLATTLRASCFESVALPDHTYFALPEREPFRMPNYQMGTPTIAVAGGSVDTQELQRALEASRAIALDLSSAAFWRMTAIAERDPWKRFDWTFLALEILTHKLARRYYDPVIASLRSQEGDRLIEVPATYLLQPFERLSLAARFTVIALALRPDSAVNDIRQFQIAKRARDAVSHGGVRDPDELPIEAATQLLAEYLRAAVIRSGEW
jgi:hypothetical protein